VAAAGILLFGAHLYQAGRTGPVPRASLTPVPGTRVAQAPMLELPQLAVPALTPQTAPALTETPAPQPQRMGPTAPAPLFPPPPATRKKPAGFIGPAAPVPGPQWKGGPLPVLGPEVLRAMMDPRTARRAQRLRRLGVHMPADGVAVASPDPAARLAVRPEPGLPGAPARAEAKSLSDLAVRGSGKPPAQAGSTPAGTPTQKGEVRSPSVRTAGSVQATGTGSLPNLTATPGGAATGVKPATEDQGGEKQETGKRAVETADASTGGAPIRLRARLDRPRPEYRVGEWVALRFFASQPAHLRAYRVDAAGRVTRLFSTYSHEESSEPARSFSMMVKAGQPRPGQERVIAIGSARPLTRDELLDCLRSYLGEGPSENPAPGAEAASGPAEGAPATTPASSAPMPLAQALRAVIDAVSRGGDLPAGMAGLDRSAWSVAIGRFVSTPRTLQQSAAGRQPVEEGPAR
jgi:hypothetical protein